MSSGRTDGTIAFSHANSFPAGTYRLLFDAWRRAGWRAIAVRLPQPAGSQQAPGAGQERGAAGLALGVRLAFRREIETQLYNTLPHLVGPLLRRHPLACPVSFIGGKRSAEVRQAGMAATEAVARGRIEWVAGGHLFPMERPEDAAAAVLRALSAHGSP